MATAQHFIGYFRVSTDRQGRSGLGLEAQRQAVTTYVNAQPGGALVREFIEVESGKRVDRPQLAAALAACKVTGAVLVIAKLDRLARNAKFLLTVVEGVGEAGVIFCDMPTIPAGPVGKFLITQLAAIAELEAGLISERTRAALRAAKARGVKLGNPRLKPVSPETAKAASEANATAAMGRSAKVVPYIAAARAAGASTLREIAEALEARGVKAPRGGSRWSAAQVARIIARAA